MRSLEGSLIGRGRNQGGGAVFQNSRSVRDVLRPASLPLVAASFVALLYIVPQLAQALHGGSGTVLLQEDEPFYAARFVRALQGLDVMSPLTYEHRHDLSIVPGFVERALAAPFVVGGYLGLPRPSAAAAIVAYRALFGFAGVLAMTFAFISTGLPRIWSTLAAFWAYVDSGVTAYKPLIGFSWHTLALDRFTNPLVGLPVFFLAWGCLARSFLGKGRSWYPLLAAGIVSGLLFYVSFYYWTLFFAVASLSSLPDLRHRVPKVASILAIALIVSVRYWYYATSFRSSGYYWDILWRTDFYAHGRGVSYNANKTMWLFVVGALAVWRLNTPSARFFALSVLGGLACFYANLVTGMEFPNSLENAHWNVALAPIVLAGCLWTVADWTERVGLGRLAAAFCSVLGATLAVGGIWSFVRLAGSLGENPAPGTGSENQAYATAWSWLRSNAPSEVVVLASEQTMGYVPLEAGKYVWVGEKVYPDSISFEEIRDRYRVLWALEGATASQLESFFWSRFTGPGTWLWPWGLSTLLVDQLKEEGWPPLDRLRWQLFVRTTVDELNATTKADVRAIGTKYRLDYVIRGPKERDWMAVDDYLALTTVFRAHDVTVDHVDGWRATRSADVGTQEDRP
jgi:hypothetical protein